VNVHLDVCELPRGAELHTFGPYTQRHCKSYGTRNGAFWSPVVAGERMVLEVYAPTAAARAALHVQLATVNRGFRSIMGAAHGAGDDTAAAVAAVDGRKRQGQCNIDTACERAEPWSDVKTAVARVLYDGRALCSGTLVKHADADDFRPFFSSAYHCVSGSESRARATVTFWGFESPRCGELCCGDMTKQLAIGSTLHFMERATDMLLIELGAKVHESADTDYYRAYYAGWDRGDESADGGVGISHPGGKVKTIAFSDEMPDVTPSCIASGSAVTHWTLVWDDGGTTEGGSSGSCLFNRATQRCVGVLSGGTASCANTAGYDCYGGFYAAYERGMTMLGDAKTVDGAYDDE